MMAFHQYGPSKYNTCRFWSCSFALLVFLLFISGITFLVCGIVVANPGLKALQFQETTCTATRRKNKPVFQQTRSCSCEGLNNKPQCKSRFPCIEIYVHYQFYHSNGSVTQIEAFLQEHEQTETSQFDECSVFSCVYEVKTNQHVVNSFFQNYGQDGENFTCYYNEENPSIAITKRNYSVAEVIVALTLPGIAFTLVLLSLFVMCFVKCRARKQQPPKSPMHRSYMNPTVLREPQEESELPLPSCCTSMTYVRQTDPIPPRKIVAHTL